MAGADATSQGRQFNSPMLGLPTEWNAPRQALPIRTDPRTFQYMKSFIHNSVPTEWNAPRQALPIRTDPRMFQYTKRPYHFIHNRHYPSYQSYPFLTPPLYPPPPSCPPLDAGRMGTYDPYFPLRNIVPRPQEDGDGGLEVSDEVLSESEDADKVNDSGRNEEGRPSANAVTVNSQERLRQAKDLWDLRWSRWWSYNWSRKREEAERQQRMQMPRSQKINRNISLKQPVSESPMHLGLPNSRRDSFSSESSTDSLKNNSDTPKTDLSSSYKEKTRSRAPGATSGLRRRMWHRIQQIYNSSSSRVHGIANKSRLYFRKQHNKTLAESNLIDLNSNSKLRLSPPILPDVSNDDSPPKISLRNNLHGNSVGNDCFWNVEKQKNVSPVGGHAQLPTTAPLLQSYCNESLTTLKLKPRNCKRLSSNTSLASLEHLTMRIEQLQNMDNFQKVHGTNNKILLSKQRELQLKEFPKRGSLNISRGTSPISIFSAKPGRDASPRVEQIYQAIVSNSSIPVSPMGRPRIENLPTLSGLQLDPTTTCRSPTTVLHSTGESVQQHIPNVKDFLSFQTSPFPRSNIVQTTASLPFLPSPPTIKHHTTTSDENTTHVADNSTVTDKNKDNHSSRTVLRNDVLLRKDVSQSNKQQTKNYSPVLNCITEKHKVENSGTKGNVSGNESQAQKKQFHLSNDKRELYPNKDGVMGNFGSLLNSFRATNEWQQVNKPFYDNYGPIESYDILKSRPYSQHISSSFTPLLRSQLFSSRPIVSAAMYPILYEQYPNIYNKLPIQSTLTYPRVINTNPVDYREGYTFPQSSSTQTIPNKCKSKSTQTSQESFTEKVDKICQQIVTNDCYSSNIVKGTLFESTSTQTDALKDMSSVYQEISSSEILQEVMKCCHQTTSTHCTEACGTQTDECNNLVSSEKYKLSNPRAQVEPPEEICDWLSSKSTSIRLKKNQKTEQWLSRAPVLKLDIVVKTEDKVGNLEKVSLRHEPRSLHVDTPSLKRTHRNKTHGFTLCDIGKGKLKSNRNPELLWEQEHWPSNSSESFTNIRDFPDASTLTMAGSRITATCKHSERTSNENYPLIIDYESLPEIKSLEKVEDEQDCSLSVLKESKENVKKGNISTQTEKRSRRAKLTQYFRRKMPSLSSTSD